MRVVCAIIPKDGKLLIAKRALHKENAGKWEFPGGKIEQDEDAFAAIIREIKEELNVIVQPISQLEPKSVYDATHDIHLESIVCELISGKFTLTDHDDLAWVFPEELDKYALSPGDSEISEYLTPLFSKDQN